MNFGLSRERPNPRYQRERIRKKREETARSELALIPEGTVVTYHPYENGFISQNGITGRISYVKDEQEKILFMYIDGVRYRLRKFGRIVAYPEVKA